MTVNEVAYQWAKTLYRRPSTKYIILHHEAGSGMTAQQIHQMHIAEGWAGIGYHYFVDKQGRVWRGRPEAMIGTHCPSRNSDSIAVCCEGNFEIETMGATQYKVLLWIVGDILKRYPGLAVKRHKDFYATACPGANYPYNKLLADLEDDMTGEEIYKKLNSYLATLPCPDWAKAEFQQAIDLDITDGTRPMELIPRYQAAIMAKRAATK